MPARKPKSLPSIENSSLGYDDAILNSLWNLGRSNDIPLSKAHNRRCQILSVDPPSTGPRQPAQSVQLLLTVSRNQDQNYVQDMGSVLQETLHLVNAQSSPRRQNEEEATTAGPLSGPPSDNETKLLVGQTVASLNELFDRAQSHGVNLSNSPDGLFLIKSVLKKAHPEQWELREMGVSSSSSGQVPWPGSWEYFEHLASHERERPVHWNAQSYCDHYEYEMFICAYITGAILTRCPMASLIDRKRWEVLRMASVDHQDPQWSVMHRALWRVWSFCRIFGSGKGRECDLQGQRAWLEGCATEGGDNRALHRTSLQSEVLDNPPESFGWGN